MSEINIRRAHHLAPEAVRRLAEAMAVRLEERFELAWHWEGDALRFQRDGVQGALTLGPGELRIQARLGFLLALARPQIEEELESQLDEMLGSGQRMGTGMRLGDG
jgi:putative polyhydroxyalkanoate system protein